jgi:hypothetical protein
MGHAPVPLLRIVGGNGMQLDESNDARTFHFAIFADYYQIYLADCQLAEELNQKDGENPVVWAARIDTHIATILSPEAYARQLGVARGTVCILTARNFTVPLTVQIRANAPADDFAEWDRVVEARLDLPSGCIVVHGPTDYFPGASRIAVAPGVYRARVYYGGLATVSADEFEGEDHYRVDLWPEPEANAEPIVLYKKAIDS